jgi:hypothetical protein
LAHWKFGDGFAIRYGGHRDIEWFYGDQFRLPGGATLIPPLHPAALALHAAQDVALVLQWWEMRKQGLLSAAQFEERRLLWLADMLTTWGVDIATGGTLRLDSTWYLERELLRLMEALINTPKMDVPSVLLLQVERTSLALVVLNTLLYRELSHQLCYIEGPERDGLMVPDYQPFNEIRSLVPVSKRPGGSRFGEVKKRLPHLFSEPDPFATYLKHAKRRSEFSPVENLMLELRGAIALLKAAQAFPPTVHTYSKDEVLGGTAGTAVRQQPSPVNGEQHNG